MEGSSVKSTLYVLTGIAELAPLLRHSEQCAAWATKDRTALKFAIEIEATDDIGVEADHRGVRAALRVPSEPKRRKKSSKWTNIGWRPGDSLAYERLLEAELSLMRGQYMWRECPLQSRCESIENGKQV